MCVGGGARKVLPYKKKGGGGETVLAILKGGGGTTSFEVVLTGELDCFSHTDGGVTGFNPVQGGPQNILPCPHY